ncbi:TetR/AcrR family transcriptional regulator [Sphingomicrobium aestuariivivum]|uniref:TetR/AcrR family transcriptional regulator n=1 Tax=Sphingomicrobium aestuariivivum TaxID=1582356 RepID=UPI001FD665D3|nr:TetR family transcriptional regulator [Sphingomicrobium aestuariivivum]MCJ8191563.1 TetR/AcrR family transcriptional regulator [Sphingomicrobium aestuariivivum]
MSPEESRAAAVAAARELLRSEGAAAVTLKAVAGRMGRTHAALLHHFGSVDELHAALANEIAQEVADSIAGSIGRYQAGKVKLRKVVEEMFTAFREQHFGELIAWVVLQRRREALKPVEHAIAGVITQITQPEDDRPLDRATMGLVLLAIGDALVGDEIARACDLPHEVAHEIAVKQILAVLGELR